MSEAQEDAFRAAAQAYAAAVLELPIKKVTNRGIELLQPANREPSWEELRAEVAMGLAGIAAVDRYGFETAPGGRVAFSTENMTEQQEKDWRIVQALADGMDPKGKQSVLADAWQLAEDLLSDNDVWAAIEWLAGIVEGVELDGIAVRQIIEEGSESDAVSLERRG